MLGVFTDDYEISDFNSDYFSMAQDLQEGYNAGLREFSPWNNAVYPFGSQRLPVTFPDQPDLPFLGSYVEPVGLRMHLKSGALNNNFVLWHELGHALHFSRLSASLRQEIQDRYIRYLTCPVDISCTENDVWTHDIGLQSTPFVAFIEAFGNFAGLYSLTTQDNADSGPDRHLDFYDFARDNLDRWKDEPGWSLSGDDVEGAVFATLFVDFAEKEQVGLDFVVSSYIDCEALTIHEYAECIVDRHGANSEIAYALAEAGAEWGIYFPAIPLHNFTGFDQTEHGTGARDEAGDEFGGAMASGDFDGDGFADLVVGGPGENTSGGVVFVYYGTEYNLRDGSYLFMSDAGWTDDAGNRFGHAVATGDFNCDGYDDIAVGAPGVNGDAGAVSIWYGSRDGIEVNSGRTLLQDELLWRHRQHRRLVFVDIHRTGAPCEQVVSAPQL